MVGPASILIDTNIIINLEDNKEIDKQYADLNRVCSQFGIALYKHESSKADVARDKNEARQKISLSKLAKYPQIHKTPAAKAEKEALFGPIKSDNDDVDTDMLVSLNLGTADLLITEDKDLINRVKDQPLAAKVLNLQNAMALLQSIFGVVSAEFMHVHDKFCNQFDLKDPFFSSLTADYPEFPKWYPRCMKEQRPCWVIMQPSGIGGMIIYKPESALDANEKKELQELGVPENKVLKLCLFKIDENIRGEKFGEQLLKKAMDYAYRNNFDTMYLTVFPKHKSLIELLQKFGFQRCGTKKTGKMDEDVYFKFCKVKTLNPHPIGFDFHKIFWPCISLSCDKYLVPLRPEFHARLFPEAARRYAPIQLGLFEDALPKTPGNAIRKAYVCNAPTVSIRSGSILLFYRSSDSVITSIGILESYTAANDLPELKDLVGKRSVYAEQELADKIGRAVPAKAVNFYYAKDLKDPISLNQLRQLGIAQPQSIAQLQEDKFKKIFDILDQEDKDIFHA